MTPTTTNFDIAALRADFAGELSVPGDEGWDEARAAWNLAVDQHPAAVAIAADGARARPAIRSAAPTSSPRPAVPRRSPPRSARLRRPAAQQRPLRPGVADRLRAPGRRSRGRRSDQQADRPGAVRDPEDRRGPPLQRLPQARHQRQAGARFGVAGMRAAAAA